MRTEFYNNVIIEIHEAADALEDGPIEGWDPKKHKILVRYMRAGKDYGLVGDDRKELLKTIKEHIDSSSRTKK